MDQYLGFYVRLRMEVTNIYGHTRIIIRGAQRNSKWGGGILRKSGIVNKMSEKGGPSPPPVCTPMIIMKKRRYFRF